MNIDQKVQERSIRTLLVSDIHLGCRFAQAEEFLVYLHSVRPEQLYILGDFLDGWKLGSRWYWNSTYSQIVDRIFELGSNGTELFYTPGNHDAFLRCPHVSDFIEKSGLRVHVADEFIYESADGRRFLVLHGDRFDVVESDWNWLSVALTYAYEPMLSVNWYYNRMLGPSSRPYTACARVKNRVKSAVRFFSHFEERLSQYVQQRKCDGIICGHIHTPGVAQLSMATYINTGDWVENCTALVESHDGEMVLESYFPERKPQCVTSRKFAMDPAAGLAEHSRELVPMLVTDRATT